MNTTFYQLPVTKREIIGKKVRALRRGDQIPAVLYGHGIRPINLTVAYPHFDKVYQAAGESVLVDLSIDKGKPVKALIQAVQLDPLTGQYLHVDFHQVKMTEKLTTQVALKFIGEAPAEKELAGVLVKAYDSVQIECLPQDLVHEIIVDLSKLKTLEDSIHVKDLPVPPGIKVLNPPDDSVAHVTLPREEEEVTAAAPEAAGVEAEAGVEAGASAPEQQAGGESKSAGATKSK